MYSRLCADISSNNSEFNAKEYRAGGGILIAIKATEGSRYVNPDHRGWCFAAGSRHIAIAHYHFARPDLGIAPEVEAMHFLSVAHPLAGGRDYLILDMERGGPGNTGSGQENWARTFAAVVKERSRFYTILYASRSTLQSSDKWLPEDWPSGKKRVHDAAYGNERDYAPPGYHCVLRQFTDGVVGPEPHSLPGVGRCDVNRMSRGLFETVAAKAR